MNRMDGKICLVAGATQGLGAAIARRLAAAGAAGLAAGAGGGLAEPVSRKQSGMFDSTSLRVENTNVSLTVNGKDTQLPPEVIAHLQKGDKIAAIKAGTFEVPLDTTAVE